MARKKKRDYDPAAWVDLAKEAEAHLSAAASDSDAAEGMRIVDEKLRQRQAEHQTERKKKRQEAVEVVEATSERTAPPVTTQQSKRERARLLILTRDRTIFEDDSSASHRIQEFADMFAEVHVIVLVTKTKRAQSTPDTKRLSDTTWAYAAVSPWWFMTVWAARQVAKRQLVFGGGFRPDIIVADDPFESSLAGYLLSEQYHRPFQVHVRDDFFEANFTQKEEHNRWRVWMAGYVLRRTACIRTQSEYMRRRIIERYSVEPGAVEVLPIYYNLNAWKDTKPATDLAKRYAQFKFILLHVSNMNQLSHTEAVIDGLYYIVRQYPTIGLVILGDGPEKRDLQKRVAEYELGTQILFEALPADTLSYIKTAQLVIHTSEESALDYVMLQAAASEVPMVCASHGTAAELFLDGESVLLCPTDSPPCFGEKVNTLLNDNSLRKKLAMNAMHEVFQRTVQDYGSYLKAYQGSVERCLVTETNTIADD